MGEPILSPLRLKAAGGASGLYDPAMTRRALALFCDANHSVELRALPSGRSRVRAGIDLDALVEDARELSAGAKGVYFCINPVATFPGEHKASHDADVSWRRWLPVDIDAERPDRPHTNAAEAEHEAARQAAYSIRDALTAEGWPLPVVQDSGNGWHLFYRIDLPNTPEARALVKAALYAIRERYNTPAVDIDKAVHNASRIMKLAGTWARKAAHSEERPHRPCLLADVPEEITLVTEEQLRALGAPKEAAPPAPETNGHVVNPLHLTAGDNEAARLRAHAVAALMDECRKMASTAAGHWNTQLDRSGAALGNLVGPGQLSFAEAFDGLIAAARVAGCDNPKKDEDTLRRALERGMTTPRRPEAPVPPPGDREAEPTEQEKLRRVATITDLINAGSQVDWLWKLWLQRGTVAALAAEAGTGKTRFVADLVRRVKFGLPWPDGQEMSLPADSMALWVVADNHHDEMVTLCKDFEIVDRVLLNAWSDDPYGGTSLEDNEDFRALEVRVKATRPLFVVVDTVGNSTGLSLSKQEEARTYYMPLQKIARRYRCVVLALTHLNASGKFLGRRVLEKVRSAIKLEKPDPRDERRALSLPKSNSKKPPSLGVLMGDGGNAYDDKPPVSPEEMQEPGRASGQAQGEGVGCSLHEVSQWLRDRLAPGAVRVSVLREEADAKGYSARTLYRAKDVIHAEEYTLDKYKWWVLPEQKTPFD